MSPDFLLWQAGSNLLQLTYFPTPVILKAWFLDREPQRHLVTCEKCRFTGPILGLIQKLLVGGGRAAVSILISLPGDSDAHHSLRTTALY